MTNLELKDLNESANSDKFSCGEEKIDFFLKDLAKFNQKNKFSRTYIFTKEENNEIIAFFSILASQLNTGDTRIFGIDKVPVILLGRLGVDVNYQGKNFAEVMIRIAIEKALKVSKIIGCRLLLVETSLKMKSYYLERLSINFKLFRDKKETSIIYIDLLEYELGFKI